MHTTITLKQISKYLSTLLKIGEVVLCSFLFFHICLANTGLSHTTLRLEIVSSFTGSAVVTGDTTILMDGIYRSTGIHQTIDLGSSLNATYTLQGDIAHIYSGNIFSSNILSLPIELSLVDGLKSVVITYSEVSGGNALVLPPLLYGIDTTPPIFTNSFSGPTGVTPENQPISFNWDAVIDTGVGLHNYIIQLSHSPIFSTAIEFTTTGTSLILGGGSITPGERYRRRGATDYLGNVIYGLPLNFIAASSPINNGTNSSIGGNSPPLEQIENSVTGDQCPGGDNSGNYFDGICSSVTQAPILLNVPVEHQATQVLPRREKMYMKLTESKNTLYIFPNYDAPKPYTIYEHTPTYVYNDIYEYKENKKDTYPQLPYQPSFGVKDGQKFTSKFAGITISRATNYLFYWFVQTTNSCTDIRQLCPVDPICQEIGSSCYLQLDIMTQDHFFETYLLWCPRKV